MYVFAACCLVLWAVLQARGVPLMSALVGAPMFCAVIYAIYTLTKLIV